MWPVMVVEVYPRAQSIGTGLVAGEDVPVGPSFLQGPVEPLGFALLPWMAGLDQDVVGLQPRQHGLEILGGTRRRTRCPSSLAALAPRGRP